MILLAVVPFLVGLVGRRLAPSVARRLRPSVAVLLLTGLALTVALATGLILCLLGVVGLAQMVPELGPEDWSGPVLRDLIALPPVWCVGAGVIGTVLLIRAGVHVARVALELRRTAAMSRSLPGDEHEDLTVVSDDTAIAYALPGRRHRIVVSTGLLRSLSADQRRALLSHERAHLRHRHHLYARAVRLAAAANPLVRPLVLTVDTALERWADGDAVHEVGDASTVAHAVGLAALASAVKPAGALGASDCAVVERVRCLLEPVPTRRSGALLLSAFVAACWVSAVVVSVYIHSVIELAEVPTGR